MNNDQYNKFVLLTKSDTVDFDTPTEALYVGGTGNIVAVMPDGTTCLFTGIPAGAILPVKLKRINSTNTTATAMVGLYHV